MEKQIVTLDELFTKLDSQCLQKPEPAETLDIPFLNGIGYILSQSQDDMDEADDLPRMTMPDSDMILLLP